MEKPFNAEDLLHIYNMVWPKKESGIPFYEGNHYLRLRNPNQSQARFVTGNLDKDLFLDKFV